jgi:hypothetical protein
VGILVAAVTFVYQNIQNSQNAEHLQNAMEHGLHGPDSDDETGARRGSGAAAGRLSGAAGASCCCGLGAVVASTARVRAPG